MKQFWVVWRLRGGVPVVQHSTEASATVEAERLARLNPGGVFFVMEAVAMRSVDNMQRVDLRKDKSDEIPF